MKNSAEIAVTNTISENNLPLRLWQSWVNCPWHYWLSDAPKMHEIIVGTLTRLPLSATTRLLQPVRPLVVLPPVDYARAIRVHVAMAAGTNIVQISAGLASRPISQAQAIFAHELGHLLTVPSGQIEKDDIAADRLAMDWGFGPGLVDALEQDLGSKHPRTIAAKKYLSKTTN